MADQAIAASKADPLPGALWAVIKNVPLRCQEGLQFTARSDREQRWWLLQEAETDTQYRIDALTYEFLQQFDGVLQPDQVWDKIQPVGIKQEDLAEQLLQLIQLDLLKSKAPLLEIQNTAEKAKKPGKVFNPVSFILYTFNPDRLLNPVAACSKYLYNGFAFFIWCAFIFSGLLLLMDNQQQLSAYLSARGDDPSYLFWLWLVYPLLKLIHEMAHALAVRRWGGQVTKAGLMLLVFIPVPFVDASASSHFSSKQARMLVAGAGVMAELLVAVIGLMLWCFSENALVQEIGFIVALLGSVSTLLFNANPLLRFDGYFVLSDWLEIPNLARRSQTYLKQRIFAGLFGIAATKVFQVHPGEMKWLVFYGPAALAYRLFITFTIAFLVSSYLLWLGGLIALWAIWLQLLRPLAKLSAELYAGAVKQQRSQRVFAVMLGLILALASVLMMPLYPVIVAEGVVILPQKAYLRAGSNGFVSQILKSDNSRVQAGQVLLVLNNDELLAERDKLEIELDLIRDLRSSLLLTEPERSALMQDQILELEVELTDLNRQVSDLTVRATQTGIFSIAALPDLQGRYIRKGELLGFVYEPGAVEVHTVLNAINDQTIRGGDVAAEVRFSGQPNLSIRVDEIIVVPQALDRLPDSVLGSRMGGEVLVDGNDEAGLNTMYPVFQFNLILPLIENTEALGKTASIKFKHHSDRTLALNILDSAREFWFKRNNY